MRLASITDRFVRSAEFRAFRDRGGKNLSIEGVAPSSFPFIIASIFSGDPRSTLVVVKNSQRLQELITDLSCFLDESSICSLAPWETLPYEFVSAPEHVERERVAALYRIISGRPAVIVATVESLVRRIPSREFLLKKGVALAVGQEYPFDDVIETLVSYGYSREHRVESYGQFSVKGGIIDAFLPTHENPVRLDFLGDTLESAREFDLESQISLSKIEGVTIYPRRELILSGTDRRALLKKLREASRRGLKTPEYIMEEHERGALSADIAGIEDLFPALMEAGSALSYFDTARRIILIEPMELLAERERIVTTFEELYRRKHEGSFCLPPAQLLDPASLDEAQAEAVSVQVFTTTREAIAWRLRGIPNFHGKIKQLREELSRRIGEGWRIVICTAFEGQARRLFDLFGEFSPPGDFETLDPERPAGILIAPLHEGFELPELKILILTDHDIFGKSYRRKRSFKKKTSRPIESFLELSADDYVVHVNHGIGIF